MSWKRIKKYAGYFAISFVGAVILHGLRGGWDNTPVHAKQLDPVGTVVAAILAQDLWNNMGGDEALFDWTKEVPRFEHVSSVALWQAYQDNGVAAHERYNGRVIEISGRIDSINRGIFSGSRVELASPNMFMPVDLELGDEYRSIVEKWRVGQTTTLDCKVGDMILGRPQLDDCQPVASRYRAMTSRIAEAARRIEKGEAPNLELGSATAT